MRGARLGALSLLGCFALLLGGCGGGEGSTSSAPPSTPGAPAPASSAFHGGDDSIQTWGRVAAPALAARLTRLVRAYLSDRAARDWAAVCARLATRERTEQGALAGGTSCARAMRSFAGHADRATLRREARIETLGVRVGPYRGRLFAFVIYRRSDGSWSTALVREAGTWKVLTVTPQQLS